MWEASELHTQIFTRDKEFGLCCHQSVKALTLADKRTGSSSQHVLEEMALTLFSPPCFDVGEAPPLNSSLVRAQTRLAQLSSMPALQALETALQLEQHSFSIIDGFLGHDDALAVRAEIRRRRLCSAARAGGQVSAGRVSALRSDVSVWAHAGGGSGRALDRLADRADALVTRLRAHSTWLSNVTLRATEAMLACYPAGGSRYVRHLDNVCTGGVGKRCNGRRLTVVYYLNDRAPNPTDGALRLFASGAPNSPPLIDIEPLLDRMAVFFSDERVPHAVLPSGTEERAAVTLWYFDAVELEARSSSGGADGGAPALSSVLREV